MLTLSLFRHAKSDPGDPQIADIDRPLNARGRAAAPLIGDYMARERLLPDLVLCSTSVRTRETAELALAGALAGSGMQLQPPETHFETVLYLASTRTLLGRIRKVGSACRHLMLIGHNPGLQSLAISLAGTGDPKAIGAIERKLPTAALVMLTFDARSFAKIAPGSGTLARFVTPKMLSCDE
jgi:phosphohistidine phosphatase